MFGGQTRGIEHLELDCKSTLVPTLISSTSLLLSVVPGKKDTVNSPEFSP